MHPLVLYYVRHRPQPAGGVCAKGDIQERSELHVQVNCKLILCQLSFFSKQLNAFSYCTWIIVHHALHFFQLEQVELYLPYRTQPAHGF